MALWGSNGGGLKSREISLRSNQNDKIAIE